VKTSGAIWGVTIAMAMLLLPACVLRKEASDPVMLQEQIAEYRNRELELVRTTVPDPARANRLIALLAERDRMIADNAKAIAEYRKRMTALNADYDAERASFDALVAGYNDLRKAAQIQFVALIAAMKKETTAEEWKILSKYQLSRLDLRKLIYDQPPAGA